MKRRILSFFLVVIMMISVTSAFCFTSDAAANISYVYNPTVYFGGGTEYNIVWKNNVAGMGYVTYKYNGQTYTVYDEEDGVVRTEDNTHSVRIPMAHLDAAGSYTVNTCEVVSRDGFNIKLGASASVTSEFRGYQGQEEIQFGFFSDTHIMVNNKKTITGSKTALDTFMGGIAETDVIVLNGDIANNMPTEQDFDLVLDIAHTLSEGKVPVLYVKGNHECRGYYAQKLYKYLVYNTGEFFTLADYGPISMIITDIGEDKEDGHEEYGGLNDMDHYLTEQLKWVESGLSYKDGSTYHMAIGHSPTFVDRFVKDEIANVITSMGTDVLVCGHSHQSIYYPPNYGTKNKLSIPVVHDGGHNDNTTMRTLKVTFKDGKYTFTHYEDSGTEKSVNTLEAKYMGTSPKAEKKESVVESKPAVNNDVSFVENTETNVPTAAGIATGTIKGAGADTTAITTKPVVFDCGDYYNIVWQTTPGIECAAYVDIKNANGSFTYTDSFSGKVRTETTHSVKVPKDVLNDSTYQIKSRVVTNYAMYGYKSNPPVSYGSYVNGTSVKFVGSNSEKKKYNILAITNANAGAGTASGSIRSSYTVTPDLIVSLGNVTGKLNTEKDFGDYLNFIAPIADNGRVPVLYLRGENEVSGNFAADIGNYIRTTTAEALTGKFYSNINLGFVSIIGLDTPVDAEDKSAKFSGYAAFDQIRKEQVTWMKDTVPNVFKGKCNLVFAHADNLKSQVGTDLTQSFIKFKTNLVVTGTSGKAALSDPGNNYAHATVGSGTGDGSYGLMLTCTEDSIEVKKLAATSTEIGTIDTTKSYAQAGGTTVTPPSTDDGDKTPTDDNNTDNNTPDDNNTSVGDDKEDTNTDNKDDDTDNNTNSDDDDDDDDDNNTSTGDGEIVDYEKGEFDGISGDDYIREIPEDWYKDYLSAGFTYTESATVKGNGVMTEGIFVHIVAKCAGINLTIYYDEDTNEDRASAWIEDCGIYSGYVGGTDVASDNIVNTIVTALFTIA